MVNITKDWRDDVEQYLILSGTVGRKWSEISARFASRTKAEPLKAHLDALLEEEKVQKFKVPNPKGQEATVWRATTKLLKA